MVVAFVSYLAWFWLIAHYPAGRLAAYSFLTPIFGALAGALLLHEHVSLELVLALLFIGIGIRLVNGPRPAPATAYARRRRGVERTARLSGHFHRPNSATSWRAEASGRYPMRTWLLRQQDRVRLHRRGDGNIMPHRVRRRRAAADTAAPISRG